MTHQPPPTRGPTPAELAAAGARLPLVLYDGDCGFCTAQARRVRRLARGRVSVEPLRVALPALPWVDEAEAGRALHLIDRDGRAYAGAAAIVRLLRLTRPLLGVLALPYHLPGVRWLAERAYAFVAARRYRIQGRVDGCADGACAVPRPASRRSVPRPQVTSTGTDDERRTRSSTPPSIDSSHGA